MEKHIYLLNCNNVSDDDDKPCKASCQYMQTTEKYMERRKVVDLTLGVDFPIAKGVQQSKKSQSYGHCLYGGVGGVHPKNVNLFIVPIRRFFNFCTMAVLFNFVNFNSQL